MSQQSNYAIAVIGIDIGKNSFHVVGQDQRGAIVLRQKWSRGQVDTRLANLPPCLIGMEACVGAHHLSRKLHLLGHNARLMPAKYVRPYSKGQKNDFRDAEAIAEAVQRPTMKFVATKTADQLDLQALHRVRERLVSQRTGIINQIRAFLLERGVAVRQGLHFLRAELPGILATRTDVLSPRVVRIIEDLSADWRRLDARIEGLSGEIETFARQDQHCERLMTVPGIGPMISSAMVAAIGTGDVFSKGRDFGAWLGLVPKQSRPETGRSLAAYQGAAIAICAPCSFRPPGSCWSSSGPSSGNAMGSNLGSKRRRSDSTTMCSPLRWLTSSPASRGRFSTRGAASRASRPMWWRPVQPDPRAVLEPVKAWPGSMDARGKTRATASLDGPCARRTCTRRPGRRNGRQARTKEQP
jgi:transposase